MFISKISFKMNVEVAPYKHEHVEVTAELDKQDDPEQAFEELRATARRFLGVDVDQEEILLAQETLKRARKAGLL